RRPWPGLRPLAGRFPWPPLLAGPGRRSPDRVRPRCVPPAPAQVLAARQRLRRLRSADPRSPRGGPPPPRRRQRATALATQQPEEVRREWGGAPPQPAPVGPVPGPAPRGGAAAR